MKLYIILEACKKKKIGHGPSILSDVYNRMTHPRSQLLRSEVVSSVQQCVSYLHIGDH